MEPLVVPTSLTTWNKDTHSMRRTKASLPASDLDAVLEATNLDEIWGNHISPFRAQDKQYSRSITVPLRRPTCDTALIAGAAISGLRQIYKSGYCLAKAGVMLLDLQDSSVKQSKLDLDDSGPDRGTLDALNTRYGRESIQLASAGVGGPDRTWTMKQVLKTPDYARWWKDLPRARA